MRYNTPTPFTVEDIVRFNHYTHFPRELDKVNADFAAESAKERENVEVVLKRWKVAEVSPEIERALERLRKARYLVFMASIRSRELAPPWTVTGPSGWSKHARPERAHRVMGKAFDELNAARFILDKRVRQAGPSNVIRSDDVDAIDQLKAKIAAARELQEQMKAANRIVRVKALSAEEKVAWLVAETRIAEARARELLQPDFAGRVGFADYQLTNNNANIRRMEERVGALERERSKESVELEFDGGRIHDCAEDARVRIYYTLRPGKDEIERLKSRGFHWTPSLSCWQRLRNPAARHAVTEITGVTWPTENSPEVYAVAADEAEAKAEVTQTGNSEQLASENENGMGAGCSA